MGAKNMEHDLWKTFAKEKQGNRQIDFLPAFKLLSCWLVLG